MNDPFPIAQLIEMAGAARIADAAGVDRTTPYSWKNGVPPQYVVRVARVVGMEPHELRPDVFPHAASQHGTSATHVPVVPQTDEAAA